MPFDKSNISAVEVCLVVKSTLPQIVTSRRGNNEISHTFLSLFLNFLYPQESTFKLSFIQ